MQYLITFLEGVISFVSPCMLPMLPLYVSYFAGGADKKRKTLLNAAAFILGFTVVFTSLGLFAGSLGMLLARYRTAVNIVCGAVVVLFGLSYLEVFRLPFLKGMSGSHKVTGFLSAFVFGVVYSVSLTPCVGAFLGSALMLASASGTALKGTLLLLVYSMGLGVPFFIAAALLDKLSGALKFIKSHYKIINRVCGGFLIAVGVAMMFGLLNSVMSLFS